MALPRRGRRPTAPSSAAGRAAGDDGFETAGIDGIEREIRMSGRGDRRPQLRLVLNPCAFDSTTEINDGLLLLDQRQVIRQIRQRLQPPIRIKDVVFRFVWCERGRRICRAVETVGIGGRAIGESFISAGVETGEDALQLLFIRGEIQIDIESVGKSDDRYQIRRRHLPIDIFHCRFCRPFDFFRLERTEIEKEDDEPAVFQIGFGQ